jgi:hypothetical protein
MRQRLPRNGGLNESAYVRLLVTEVVEVKYIDVGFAAVHAGMTEKIVSHSIL